MTKEKSQKNNTKDTSNKIGRNYTPEDIKKFDAVAAAIVRSLNKNAK